MGDGSKPRLQSTTAQRLTRVAILALTVVQILLFVYVATFGWQNRELMLRPGDPEIALRTRTAFANGIWLCINVIAVTVYALRRGRTARYALAAALALDLVNSIGAGVRFASSGDATSAILWWVFGAIPLVALVFLAPPATP